MWERTVLGCQLLPLFVFFSLLRNLWVTPETHGVPTLTRMFVRICGCEGVHSEPHSETYFWWLVSCVHWVDFNSPQFLFCDYLFRTAVLCSPQNHSLCSKPVFPVLCIQRLLVFILFILSVELFFFFFICLKLSLSLCVICRWRVCPDPECSCGESATCSWCCCCSCWWWVYWARFRPARTAHWTPLRTGAIRQESAALCCRDFHSEECPLSLPSTSCASWYVMALLTIADGSNDSFIIAIFYQFFLVSCNSDIFFFFICSPANSRNNRGRGMLMCFLQGTEIANHIFSSCCSCCITVQRNTLRGKHYASSIEIRTYDLIFFCQSWAYIHNSFISSIIIVYYLYTIVLL